MHSAWSMWGMQRPTQLASVWDHFVGLSSPRALSGAIGALAATASQLKMPCDLPSSPVFTTDVSRPNPQETPRTQILCF